MSPVDEIAALSTAPATVPRLVAKRLALAVDDFMESPAGIVILAYHRVGARTVSPVDLPTTAFRRQIEFVAERVASIGQALPLLKRTAKDVPSSDFPIVISFDDGTSDFVDVALPILVEYGVPALLYLSTSNIDSGESYGGGAKPLSWSAVRECVSTGLVEIGSHTHDHLLLDRCSEIEAFRQLAKCDERIEDEVGCTPGHFAYPKAVAPSAAVDHLVRERYLTAAVAGTRPNVPGKTDRFLLHRSPIQNADGWYGFVRKAQGGLRIEDDVRRVINLVRYRSKTS